MHAVKLCLLPCLPNVVHQVTQVMALFYIGPGVYTIFTRASVIFTALLALAFFPEERVVIRQWQFQVGTLLGLIGAFGVIWFQADANSHDQHVALPGLFIAFTATFCWALYGVLIKRPSAELGSIRSFGLVSFITSTLLFPLTLAFFLPGFLANDSRTPSFGAPGFCSSVPSLQCEPSRSPQQKQLKIFNSS
jgi:drug/metabolite transporter (DMT)-like permease